MFPGVCRRHSARERTMTLRQPIRERPSFYILEIDGLYCVKRWDGKG